MQYLPNGMVTFVDYYEMLYDLFMEMGLAVRSDQYVYDQDTSNMIMFKDKYLKASLSPVPVYAGKTDIVFDPARNYALVASLFGMYLDKCVNSEDGDVIGGYIAHYIDDNPERDKQRVVVKSSTRGEIASNFYINIYLAYFDCIFKIAGYNPDLSKFDIVTEG